MADNITIQIGADSSKLRADIAIAEAQLKTLGANLRQAGQVATVTGDRSEVEAIASQYEGVRHSLVGMRSEYREASREASQHSEHVATLGARMREAFTVGREHLGHLHERFHEFGRSVTEMADRVFPHFKEILALSLAGAAYELNHHMDEVAAKIRDTVNLSKSLGISTGDMEAAELTGAQFGLEGGDIGKSMGRMLKFLGERRVEQLNEFGGASMSGGGSGDVKIMRMLGSAPTEPKLDPKYFSQQMIADSKSQYQKELDRYKERSARQQMERSNESLFSDTSVVRGSAGKLNVDLKGMFDDIARSSKDPIEKISEMARRIELIKDQTIKASEAQKVMGRNWVQMLPALTQIGKDLEANKHRLEHAGLDLTPDEEKGNLEFLKSRSIFEQFRESVERLVFGALNQAKIPLFDAMTEFMATHGHEIREWAAHLGKDMADFSRDLVSMFKGAKPEDMKTSFGADLAANLPSIKAGIIEVINGLKMLWAMLGQIATAINAVFGTHTNAAIVGVAAAVFMMSGAFTVIGAAVMVLVPIIGGVVAVLGGPLTAAVVGLAAGLAYVAVNWRDVAAAAQMAWEALKSVGAWLAEGFVSAIQSAFGAITGLAGQVIGALNKVAEAAQSAMSAVASALGLGGGAGGSGGDYGGGGSGAAALGASDAGVGTAVYATGGYVSGPGSGTSDSILARISNGEYIINSARTRQLGLGFLNALNFGRYLPRFASGGLVGSMSRGGGGTPVHIHFGDKTYETSASPSTAAALAHEARTRLMLRTGAKPSWAGA